MTDELQMAFSCPAHFVCALDVSTPKSFVGHLLLLYQLPRQMDARGSDRPAGKEGRLAQ